MSLPRKVWQVEIRCNGLILTKITRLRISSYERIIVRIATIPNRSERVLAQKLLGWMVCAKRPFKWHEIQGAISTDTESQEISFNERRLRIHIRDLCGSLVDVLPGDRVELVHWTAKGLAQFKLVSTLLMYTTGTYFAKGLSAEER